MSSQTTLVATPGSGLRRASAERKRNEHENVQSRLPTRLPRLCPSTERGGLQDEKTQELPKPSPIRQETPQALTLKRRKHQKQVKEKNPDLKIQENGKLSSAAAA